MRRLFRNDKGENVRGAVVMPIFTFFPTVAELLPLSRPVGSSLKRRTFEACQRELMPVEVDTEPGPVLIHPEDIRIHQMR